MSIQKLALTEYPPRDPHFKPALCAWYPIKYVYSAIGWYIVVNDPKGVHSPRPYLTFLDYGQQAYWDRVIESHPYVEFMIVRFSEPEKRDE